MNMPPMRMEVKRVGKGGLGRNGGGGGRGKTFVDYSCLCYFSGLIQMPQMIFIEHLLLHTHTHACTYTPHTHTHTHTMYTHTHTTHTHTHTHTHTIHHAHKVQSLSNATEYLRFMPSSVTLDRIRAGIINTSFNILLNSQSRVEREEVVVETLISPRISREILNVVPLGCPAGYTLPPADSDVQEYGSCRCDQQHPQVVDCDRRRIFLTVSMIFCSVL